MGKSVSAPTIDPGPAIEQFQLAADVIEDQYPKAFEAYRAYLTRGTQGSLAAFGDAMQANLPYSDTALTAMNELRAFTGLEPFSKTAGTASSINTLIQQLEVSPLFKHSHSQQLSSLLQKIKTDANLLEQTTDPNKRDQYRYQISQELDNILNSYDHDMQLLSNAERARVGKYGISGLDFGNETASEKAAREAMTYEETEEMLKNLSPEEKEAWGIEDWDKDTPHYFDLFSLRGAAKYQAKGMDPDEQLIELKRFMQEKVEPGLRDIKTQFDTNFEREKPKAYTGEEIQGKLEELPEYQFQLKQGTKALERSQAARGGLLSGNALLEAQDFGQNLAQNVYSGHVNRLAGLAGMVLPNAGAQQGYGIQGGQTFGGFYGSLGQNAQGYLKEIANARQSAFNQAGQTMYDAAKTNAEMELRAGIANQQAGIQGLGMGLNFLGGLF